MELRLQLETLTCPTCVAKIEKVLKTTKGVNSAEVMFMASRVKTDINLDVVTSDEIVKKIETLGYKVLNTL